MSCLDSSIIIADHDYEFTIHGHIQDEYPGCGICPTCCYRHHYDDSKIDAAYQAAQDWHTTNPYKYVCTWSNKNGHTGTFEFRSSSLSKAREVAQSSVYDWVSLYVSKV
jgi:hypothetical protein